MPDQIDGSKAVYARTPAWHRKGTVFNDQDVFSAEQALAILNPEDELVRTGTASVSFVDKNGKKHTVTAEDSDGIVDFDHETGLWRVLSFQSKQYGVVQLRDQFAFMDEVIGNIDGAHYEAAVKLRKGKQVCLTAQLGGVTLDPGGINDRIYRYLWGFNSYDGSWALRLKKGDFRVECANMAACALRGSTDSQVIGSDWSVRHTSNIMGRIDEAKAVLGFIQTHDKLFDAQAEHMIHVPLVDNTFTRVIEGLFTAENPKTNQVETDKEAVAQVRMVYELSPSQANLFETVWGGFNAVVEYHDWATKVRGSKNADVNEQRFRRQIEDKDALKQRAWDAFWNVAADAKTFKMPQMA